MSIGRDTSDLHQHIRKELSALAAEADCDRNENVRSTRQCSAGISAP